VGGVDDPRPTDSARQPPAPTADSGGGNQD
jgi:hypothetical protein